MASFGPKPCVNPFGKPSIFRHFALLVFIAQKGVFAIQNIVKIIFLTNIAQKKMLEKWPYPDQNDGLTPLEKCQFFDVSNFLFLLPRKPFFSIQNIEKVIFLTYSDEKKMLKKWLYLDQDHGLTLLEKSQFFDFLNFMFLQPRKAFFLFIIS